MIKTPIRDEKRDKDLIQDYKLGIPMHKINAKYGISSTRIYQILNHYKVERNKIKDVNED